MRGILTALLFTVSLLFSTSAWAITVPPRPNGPVYDGANVLTPTQEQALAKKLTDFDNANEATVVVAIIPSLNGENIREVGYSIAQGWGIGHKGKNNGVLLLIAAAEARKAGPGARKCGCATIEVGEYLEGNLTDSRSVQILKKQVLKPVVAGKFNQAANGGVDGIINHLSRATTSGGGEPMPAGAGLVFGIMVGMVLLFIVVMAVGSSREQKRYRQTMRYRGTSYRPSSTSSSTPRCTSSSVYPSVSSSSRPRSSSSSSRRRSSRRRSSSSSSSSGGFGGFGGGGGGGFGGFGGGSFGGGGGSI